MRAILFLILFSIIIYQTSCKKGWLDVKPQQSLIVPDNIPAMISLLENTYLFNDGYTVLGESGCDDYYVPTNLMPSDPFDRNVYIWASTTNFYGDADTRPAFDWNQQYKGIFTLNTVLKNLEAIPETQENSVGWRKVKGRALFFRAFNYYCLAQIYCKPYIPSSASTDLGLILRIIPDINDRTQRSTVQETYDLILKDLTDAMALLTDDIDFKSQPSLTACQAMLARVYLSMDNYDKALEFADATLQNNNNLIDYNIVDNINIQSGLRPFVQYNKEVIFHSRMMATQLQPILASVGRVDTTLFNSYQTGDLRKTRFFRLLGGKWNFVGNYGYEFYKLFNGLASNEVYIIKAECLARKGMFNEAMDGLNALLKTRWDSAVSYTDLTAADAEEALEIILAERRKELCFRGIRWSDLRRLNKDQRFDITLMRVTDQTHTLPPNDNRYVYPIPPSEITHSGVQKNPR